MEFSIFEDDGTLGLDNSRVVVLRGSTTPSQLFSPNLFPIDSYIRTALGNAGFSVNAVRTSNANWIGYAQVLEIELNVYNNHTSEQARANAIRAIEAYTANYGLNRVFSNTTLSVAYDGYQPPASGSNASRPRPSNSPPSSFDQAATATGGSDSGFLDKLGLGLGVSTPIVLGGAALVVLLILRK